MICKITMWQALNKLLSSHQEISQMDGNSVINISNGFGRIRGDKKH